MSDAEIASLLVDGCEVVTNEEWAEVSDHINVLPTSTQIKGIFTILRDRTTTRSDFVFHTHRITRLMVEFGLSFLPFQEKEVTTPTGDLFSGLAFTPSLCGVAVIRSGEAMEDALRSVCRSVRIGKILIQRNKKTGNRDLIYARLPDDIVNRNVLLLDPVAASGRTIIRSMEVLIKAGVPEENIIFVSLVASRIALLRFKVAFPTATVCVGEVDLACKDSKVIPGLGAFGDRYYGTVLPPLGSEPPAPSQPH